MNDLGSKSAVRQTTGYLKELFSQVGFTIDSRRGQNFLVDLNLLDLLEKTAAVLPKDIVLEVGTGTGALTERLAKVVSRVITVEIDPRLAQLARERLIDHDNVLLIEGDVLASKHVLAPNVVREIERARGEQPKSRVLLVANLPYCVATPVISNLLLHPRAFDAATVTVQKEMAERMAASAGSSSYNALSVWIGCQCDAEIVRVLPPSVFWPRPKVDSAIVRLDINLDHRARLTDARRFHSFIRDVFCHRRKILRGVLLRMAGGKKDNAAVQAIDKMYATLNLPQKIRAEDIPPDLFIDLEKEFFHQTSKK
ncbi:MAG: 16S rRNA (adenine(1518)-N(6)/adenine(1519)-N(6))-dimethyltransferase RsmA [Pirellulales bacterium]